ncbi:MAG: adenylate kinase [Acidimicrobiales bacterium]|jgi:adenylate kinase
MKPLTVIFIGPQGSGKGTQVAYLTEYLNEMSPDHEVVNIETGKGFRNLTQTDTYTARRVKEIIAEGGLIPNFLTKSFVIKYLIKNLTPDSHITMDGFPRNLGQVQFIDDLMAFYKREGLSIIYLDTPEDVVRARMHGRQRSDDTDELIDERLRLYREQTEPIISKYEQRDDVTFIHIDGTKPIDEVRKIMVEGLGIEVQ